MQLLYFALLAVSTHALHQNATLVETLPHYQGRQFPVMYSGFLNPRPHRHLHYIFTPAVKSDPMNSPVVIWMNGGPGCSSIGGLFFEHGPVTLLRNKTSGSGYLVDNDASWANIANMIYLTTPVGSGFSYDSNGTAQYCNSAEGVCKIWNDTADMWDNYHAVRQFLLEVFPKYQHLPLFVTGESFGGIYVPLLSSQLVDDQDLNFQGMMVGNGCLDNGTFTCGGPKIPWVRLLTDFGIVPPHVLKDYEENWEKSQVNHGMTYPEATQKISHARNIIQNNWDKLDPYNIELTNCNNEQVPTQKPGQGRQNNEAQMASLLAVDGSSKPKNAKNTTTPNGWPTETDGPAGKTRDNRTNPDRTCPLWDNSVMGLYFGDPEVQRALNVNYSVSTHGMFSYYFLDCNEEVFTMYQNNLEDMYPYYLKVLQANKRVWFYSGLLDTVVPTVHTMPWFEHHFLRRPRGHDWKRFQLPTTSLRQGDIFVGYVTEFIRYNKTSATPAVDPPASPWAPPLWVPVPQQFLYLGIRDAGHEAPTDAPWTMLEIFRTFIYGLQLKVPRY